MTQPATLSQSITGRVAVFTASFGPRRDPVLEPTRGFDKTCDWIYFTDIACSSTSRWEFHTSSFSHMDPRKAARSIKLMPHKFLPDYDYWVWVDANILPLCSPREMLKHFIHGSWDLAMHRHIARTRLDEELEACLDQDKDDHAVMRRQVQGYMQNGYREIGDLPETGVILRKNTERVRQLGDLWWDEVKEKSVRDQLSISYVLRKLGMRYYPLPENSRQSTLFSYVKHPLT